MFSLLREITDCRWALVLLEFQWGHYCRHLICFIFLYAYDFFFFLLAPLFSPSLSSLKWWPFHIHVSCHKVSTRSFFLFSPSPSHTLSSPLFPPFTRLFTCIYFRCKYVFRMTLWSLSFQHLALMVSVCALKATITLNAFTLDTLQLMNQCWLVHIIMVS